MSYANYFVLCFQMWPDLKRSISEMMDLAKKKAEKGSPVEDCVLCDQVEMYF